MSLEKLIGIRLSQIDREVERQKGFEGKMNMVRCIRCNSADVERRHMKDESGVAKIHYWACLKCGWTWDFE